MSTDNETPIDAAKPGFSEKLYRGAEYFGLGDLRDPRSKRVAINQFVALLGVFATAFGLWRGAALLTNTVGPIVVVLSGSMEPAIHRGDLLLLHLFKTEYKTGDIVVFKTEIKDIPIVHRVSEVHERNGTIWLLTKGDNNNISDRGFYSRQGDWLEEKLVIGRIVGFIPSVGMITIIMNENPWVKFLLIAGFAISILVQRD